MIDKEKAQDKLKPCPFCGGSATIVNRRDMIGIGCYTCDIYTRSTFYYDGVEVNKIIEKWNRRVKG